MPINLQQVINSHHTVNIVSALARAVPPGIGYPACNLIGRWAAAQRQSGLIQAVRLNQWMARGASLNKQQLDNAVRETLQNNVRDLYDLNHYLERPEALWHRIKLNPLAEELTRRPEFAGRGLMIVGVHLGGFDSVVMSLVRQGGKTLLLTIPNPQGGRRVEFEMRRRTGMNILPASLDTLRQTVRHLERGGLVLTGIDRPVPELKLRPRFFGQPASLPTHHIVLALKAHVPLVLMAVTRHKDGCYHVLNSELVEMERSADHDTEILQNAEKLLKEAEGFIRRAPQQWNMPLPIWPDLLKYVPD